MPHSAEKSLCRVGGPEWQRLLLGRDVKCPSFNFTFKLKIRVNFHSSLCHSAERLQRQRGSRGREAPEAERLQRQRGSRGRERLQRQRGSRGRERLQRQREAPEGLSTLQSS
jgi:hypothetical protein